MAKRTLSLDELKAMIRRRRARGIGLLDEVWDGVYVMVPDADNEHQELGMLLAHALIVALGGAHGYRIAPNYNISDRDERWTRNYRKPDLSVFLPGNPAEDRKTHWLGGPDLAVEIVSHKDRSRRKFDFYAAVGVRELLIVDRGPWRLELHRNETGGWRLAGSSTIDQPGLIKLETLGLWCRLVPGPDRPQIELHAADRLASWLA